MIDNSELRDAMASRPPVNGLGDLGPGKSVRFKAGKTRTCLEPAVVTVTRSQEPFRALQSGALRSYSANRLGGQLVIIGWKNDLPSLILKLSVAKRWEARFLLMQAVRLDG